MVQLAANPMLPTWVVLPAAGVALLAIGLHLVSLRQAPMPASRRRIRMASGVMLAALTVLLAYALGFVGVLPSGGGSAGEVRAFVVVWMAIIGILPVVLGLAGLDMINTYRLWSAARRAMRRELRGAIVNDVEIRVKARLGRVASPASSAGPGSSGAGDDDGQRR